MKKVLLITEYLNPPYDEGIKKTVYILFCELEKKYSLQIICRYGFKKSNIHIVKTNALFLLKGVRDNINNFKPDVIIYFPFASSTFAGYLRLKILSLFAKESKSIFIALQPKPLKKWQKLIIRFIKPKYALTPSPTLKEFWDSINVNNQLFPLLTDLSIFRPIKNAEQKRELRNKYNLPQDAFLILHTGHLNEGRNLKSLIHLQKVDNQIVIVGSSSTPKDSLGPESLKKELEDNGVIIFDGFIDNIEEIYQLSDLYIFPVIAQNSSIGMPLSILEARACGIPVVTTDFGSMKKFLGDDYGGIFYGEPDNFINLVKQIKNEYRNYKKSKVGFLNRKYYEILTSVLKD